MAQLREAGCGLRDVGRLLGILYQRAAQIEQEPRLTAAATWMASTGFPAGVVIRPSAIS
ncbi:MAG: hypothetical protein ACREQM_02490 [Candidatus Dormibacteraceae bacterium]